jgi:hypothetical protein
MLQIKTVQLSIEMSTNENTQLLLDMEEENQNGYYSLQVNWMKLVLAFHILLRTS